MCCLAAQQPCAPCSADSVVGLGVPPGGIPGVGVHVPHPLSVHGPAEVASARRGDLFVLGAIHAECYLDTEEG